MAAADTALERTDIGAIDIRAMRKLWWVGTPRATPARQPSTLLMSGVGKRSAHKVATAPLLDSTQATEERRHGRGGDLRGDHETHGLVKLLDYMRGFDDVWFCTGADIARDWRDNFPAVPISRKQAATSNKDFDS